VAGLARHRNTRESLAQLLPSRLEGSDDSQSRWWTAQITKLIEGLERLQAELLAENAATAEHGWSVPRRLTFAEELKSGFEEDGEYAQAWADALPAIHEAYPELDLTPQMGLLPIGPDPESGLWEFAHLMTGEPAERSPDGKLLMDEKTGLVLVLLPEGRFLMGAQDNDASEANYDPAARSVESPLHPVTLSAFFISKYEMTQGQWIRLTQSNPSYYHDALVGFSLLHPVEQVTWDDCTSVLGMGGLSLPSEAQWEYAARAGTTTTWWTGSTPQSLIEPVADNLADRSAGEGHQPVQHFESWLDDGYANHAPVGQFSANPFGLHDIHGNVWEWCLDGYDREFYARSSGRDPISPPRPDSLRMVRGGCYLSTANQSGSGLRINGAASNADGVLGVRPARAIAP
jgi:formylglycine-generating enzyme required for sulfatase activity